MKKHCPLCEAGLPVHKDARATPFVSQPGKLFDCCEAAERAIECHPDLYPAGYRYSIMPVRKSGDRSRTVMEMAAVVACDKDGNFVGYGRNPEEL
jgi:hypothetical protein